VATFSVAQVIHIFNLTKKTKQKTGRATYILSDVFTNSSGHPDAYIQCFAKGPFNRVSKILGREIMLYIALTYIVCLALEMGKVSVIW
jgi:uncharacterized protein YwbE